MKIFHITLWKDYPAWLFHMNKTTFRFLISRTDDVKKSRKRNYLAKRLREKKLKIYKERKLF